MTMNGAVVPVLAMYIVAAEEQVTMAIVIFVTTNFATGSFSRQVVGNNSKRYSKRVYGS